jgi:hypothetical protein
MQRVMSEPRADSERDFQPEAHVRFERWLGLDDGHELVRFVLLRLLGFVYCAAFASLTYQVLPLIGADGKPWLLHVVWKLLHADPGVRSLLAHDPFGATPPRHVRIMRYRYRLAPLGSGATWLRELEGYWLPPLPADDILRDALEQLGYLERDANSARRP